ncbi:hypothetical protein K458DRAFT_57470 [Lentithecium fluviatile CBS 122367]|uniref:Uncharacterized protein n=1 Tax=Lentithecium fluviatile CBS 122367 TaxID=1168545 RepID=A0A6G1IVQ7_9PLEO|nr:hypothetical protein K458DRAFT_57470 [Lentithecium fluviatile CBS 122367]
MSCSNWERARLPNTGPHGSPRHPKHPASGHEHRLLPPPSGRVPWPVRLAAIRRAAGKADGYGPRPRFPPSPIETCGDPEAALVGQRSTGPCLLLRMHIAQGLREGDQEQTKKISPPPDWWTIALHQSLHMNVSCTM